MDQVLPLVSFEALGANLAPLYPPVTFPFPLAALCEARLAITFDLDIRHGGRGGIPNALGTASLPSSSSLLLVL